MRISVFFLGKKIVIFSTKNSWGKFWVSSANSTNFASFSFPFLGEIYQISKLNFFLKKNPLKDY
jgi:hypothetical protein